ncbi:MAG TPA: glucose 1-dehydrogenase [Xanthobacteraceae bacterium]|jgi:NAD(P)-dependent dehydrogenase (short-subunit alcohol dehydrogenase family)|nr:glucose 1-dehydrogenase [Xanthobacteraceae bacterium]
MMPSLAGKVALVTGSSQGIGAALAVALAAEGAKVVVSDVQDCADTVEQIAEQGGEAIGVPADVTDNKSLKELVATAETALGPVDVLVNNAGIFGTLQLKPLMQISEEEWDAVFRVNARGVFQATKAVIPSMQRAGGGSIINISSGTVLRGAPMFLHYVGSKGAVFAMTRAMANELAADEIRVNSIIAGFTASKSVLNHPVMMEKIRPHTLNARMIKRDMLPEDLCGAAVFLASDASAFITGQAINVDGGAITY